MSEHPSLPEKEHDVNALDEPLAALGLTRLHLIGAEKFKALPLTNITNHVVVALFIYMKKNGEIWSFVSKWLQMLCLACTKMSQFQIFSKADRVLSRSKLLREQKKKDYLESSFIDSSYIYKANAYLNKPQCHDCDSLHVTITKWLGILSSPCNKSSHINLQNKMCTVVKKGDKLRQAQLQLKYSNTFHDSSLVNSSHNSDCNIVASARKSTCESCVSLHTAIKDRDNLIRQLKEQNEVLLGVIKVTAIDSEQQVSTTHQTKPLQLKITYNRYSQSNERHVDGDNGYPNMLYGDNGYPNMLYGDNGYPNMLYGDNGYPNMLYDDSRPETLPDITVTVPTHVSDTLSSVKKAKSIPKKSPKPVALTQRKSNRERKRPLPKSPDSDQQPKYRCKKLNIDVSHLFQTSVSPSSDLTTGKDSNVSKFLDQPISISESSTSCDVDIKADEITETYCNDNSESRVPKQDNSIHYLDTRLLLDHSETINASDSSVETLLKDEKPVIKIEPDLHLKNESGLLNNLNGNTFSWFDKQEHFKAESVIKEEPTV